MDIFAGTSGQFPSQFSSNDKFLEAKHDRFLTDREHNTVTDKRKKLIVGTYRQSAEIYTVNIYSGTVDVSAFSDISFSHFYVTVTFTSGGFELFAGNKQPNNEFTVQTV